VRKYPVPVTEVFVWEQVRKYPVLVTEVSVSEKLAEVSCAYFRSILVTAVSENMLLLNKGNIRVCRNR
jgi:hypothetical protein